MINLNNNDLAINKIKSLFKNPKHEENIEYKYFYAIKAELYKACVANWDEAKNSVLPDIDNRFDAAVKWFNEGKKRKERKLEIVSIDNDTKDLFVLISCVEKQDNKKVINKFGAFSRYLYNEQCFNKLVKNRQSKNRLFSIDIREVDTDFNNVN